MAVSARSAREFEVIEKMVERTEWQRQRKSLGKGEGKRNGRLVGVSETSGELAEWRRLQRKNLSILGRLKRKEWPRCHRASSWQERQNRLFQKEDKQSHLSRSPDREVGKSQGERESDSGERRGIKAVAWGRKVGLDSEEWRAPSSREMASKENLRKRSRRDHEQVNGCTSSPGGSGRGNWFYSKCGHTRNMKGDYEKDSLLRQSEMSRGDS